MVNRIPAEGGWHSVHLHFEGSVYSGVSDEVLRGFVTPFTRTLSREDRRWRCFFIRYSDKGPHIRLRMRRGGTPTQRERLLLNSRLAEALAGPAGGIGAGPARAWSEVIQRVEWQPYCRERERYGGEVATALAERLFEASSRLALRMVERGEPGQEARLAQGMLATLVAAWALCDDTKHAAATLRAYHEGYLSRAATQLGQSAGALQSAYVAATERQRERLVGQIGDIWGRLQRQADVGPGFNAYRRALLQYRKKLEEAWHEGRTVVPGHSVAWHHVREHILPSQIHMTNNRLGVSIPHEAFLAFALGALMEGSWQA